MKLLVVIVTYNAMKWAERCFDSLRKSTLRPDVFVVDNGSTDGTQCYIQEHYPEVIFRQSEKNLGFGKANNIGLQYALDNEFDFIYLLNQDAWVMNDTFEKLTAISKRNTSFGILSPFQMNADLKHIDGNFVANVLSWKSNPSIVNDMYNQDYKEVYEVQEVMAAHWFMTRDCVTRIGGFSPSFPHYSEDFNYIDRLRFAGLKVGVVPSLRVVHDRGGRENSIEKQLYMMYTGYIRTLSNPMDKVGKSLLIVLYVALKGSIEFKSARPLMNFLKVLFNIRHILTNRRISKNIGTAFLAI